MTTTAERAALHGDCTAVRMLGLRVRELDPVYFQAAFVPNPVIAGCRTGVRLDAPVAADAPGGVVGPRFAGTSEFGVGGGIWTADGSESLSGPGGPSFGFGSFLTPKLALTFRVAGATHIGDGIVGYLGFAGPSLQGWLGEQAFVGGGIGLGVFGGCGGEDCGGVKGLGLDLRGGYAFHPAGFSGGNVSVEMTTLSVDGGTLKTFSILLGYQSF